jgi:hypothetical protein
MGTKMIGSCKKIAGWAWETHDITNKMQGLLSGLGVILDGQNGGSIFTPFDAAFIKLIDRLETLTSKIMFTAEDVAKDLEGGSITK